MKTVKLAPFYHLFEENSTGMNKDVNSFAMKIFVRKPIEPRKKVVFVVSFQKTIWVGR